MAVVTVNPNGDEYIFDLFPEYMEDIEEWIPLDNLFLELPKGTISKILGHNITYKEAIHVELPRFLPGQIVAVKKLFYLSFPLEFQECLKEWKHLEGTEYVVDKLYIVNQRYHLYTLKDFPVPDLFWNIGGLVESSNHPSRLDKLERATTEFKILVTTLLEALENKL